MSETAVSEDVFTYNPAILEKIIEKLDWDDFERIPDGNIHVYTDQTGLIRFCHRIGLHMRRPMEAIIAKGDFIRFRPASSKFDGYRLDRLDPENVDKCLTPATLLQQYHQQQLAYMNQQAIMNQQAAYQQYQGGLGGSAGLTYPNGGGGGGGSFTTGIVHPTSTMVGCSSVNNGGGGVSVGGGQAQGHQQGGLGSIFRNCFGFNSTP